jgi:hypothetical protein
MSAWPSLSTCSATVGVLMRICKTVRYIHIYIYMYICTYIYVCIWHMSNCQVCTVAHIRQSGICKTVRYIYIYIYIYR